jgi:electron transfer flavoprotein alpha subunit
MDCLSLTVDPETKCLLQIKPVYGGNAVALWIPGEYYPRIVSMRPRVTQPAEPDSSRKGEIIRVSFEVDDSRIKERLIRTQRDDVRGIKLEEAEAVVAGGGGIGGSEGFHMMEELAKLLRGAIGVTRVPCDEGWMPKSLEIGQTGHIVTPSLYIAVGISGAPQHLAGCSGSKCIVAINKDSDANIFKEADFGLVGDYREALPSFIEKYKSLFKS